jgi:hypothetical protein
MSMARSLWPVLKYNYIFTEKAMNKLHLRAYRVRCMQELKYQAKVKRIVYCRWFRTFVGNHGIEEFDGFSSLTKRGFTLVAT